MKIVQLHIARLTLLLVIVNAFWMSIFSIVYYSNQDYFTDSFCINKAKPELHCNGKCHLNKVTQTSVDGQQTKTIPVALSAFYVTSDYIYSFDLGFYFLHKPKDLVTIGEPVRWVTSIFHPPSIV